MASNSDDFKIQLKVRDNFDNWFLAWLHNDIESSKMKLKENEVFSFINPPIHGGDYTIDNIKPLDILVHFQLLGQICEQTKDLPDGTKVNIKVDK